MRSAYLCAFVLVVAACKDEVAEATSDVQVADTYGDTTPEADGSDVAEPADGSSAVDVDVDVETSDTVVADDGSGAGDVADDIDATDVAIEDGSGGFRADGGCETYVRPASQGRLPEGLIELSGLAASRVDNTRLWGHNDSGDEGRLFAFGLDGVLHGTLDLDITPRDWEDMSAGPCDAEGSGDCLFVGDIGDNAAARDTVVVYRVIEPAGFDGEPTFDSMTLSYPDGARDAEAMFVDNMARVYVLSKATGESALYRAAYAAGETGTFERLGVLDLGALPASGAALVTGADYDPSTGRLIVRAYAGVAEYLPGAGTDASALVGLAGRRLSAGFEVQGEAIAYFGGGYVHAAEGASATIYRAVCGR